MSRLQEQASSFSLEQIFRVLEQLERKSGQKQQVSARVNPMPRYSRQETLRVDHRFGGWRIECSADALTGPRGVLPHYLRDAALDLELESGDRAMGDFFSLFESAWLERLARGRRKYDLGAMVEQDKRHRKGIPHINELLVNLLPGGGHWLRHPEHFIRYIGLLGPAHRHLSGLRAILQDYFGYSIVVRSAAVKRHRVDSNACVALGGKGCQSLGKGLFLGSSGYLDSWRVDVLLMPKDRRQLQACIGVNELSTALSHLARLYLGDRTPVAVFVIARRRFLKSPVLSSRNPLSRLGQSVCLAPERYPEGIVRIRLRV